MICYGLFEEMRFNIEEKYYSQYDLYSEEPPKRYKHTKRDLRWNNYGIRLVHSDITIAVLCEYDQNEPDDGIYVGVKVLSCSNPGDQLSQFLIQKIDKCGGTFQNQKGAQGRMFYWPYWETIPDSTRGMALFEKLLESCNEYIRNQI